MFSIPGICGMGLNFTVDGFRIVFCLMAVLTWLFAGLYSIEYFKDSKNKTRYHIFAMITFIAIEGVFLSADFFTLFIFFEVMSVAAYSWVAFDERGKSLRAADTYMAAVVMGGLVMLMGIFLLYSATGTLVFSELKSAFVSCVASAGIGGSAQVGKLWAAGICLLLGFYANVGVFPLHSWNDKGYPVSPAPASALLSGMVTKAGLFGVIILSLYVFCENDVWGVIVMMSGVVTMIVGAFFALLSINLKRTFVYSTMSQAGFILIGIGMSVLMAGDNTKAAYGTVVYMLNHSFIMLVFFMVSGVIKMNTKSHNLNTIRGFGRNKPLFAYVFLMGSLSIGSVPLFNGYVASNLIYESIKEYTDFISMARIYTVVTPGMMHVVKWAFDICVGMSIAYMLKLFVCIFVEKNEDEALQEKYDSLRGKYTSGFTTAVLAISATVIPVTGIFPFNTVLRLGDFSADFMNTGRLAGVSLYSSYGIKGMLLSIVIGIIVYIVIVRGYLMSRYDVNDLGIESLEDALSGELKARAEGRKYKMYVYRWNKYLDIENVFYRPVFLRFLPFIFGVVSRFLDSLIDWIVVFIRKTILRDSKIPQELEEGNIITHIIGTILEKIQDIKNLTIVRRKGTMPQFEDYEHKAAMTYERIEESVGIIIRSMSFGLILFCIGLLLTVTYIFIAR